LLFGNWKGWWRTKHPASIQLAKIIFDYLDGDAPTKITDLISKTNHLGNALIASFKERPINQSFEKDVQLLITKLLEQINPFVVQLSVADKEHDNLKGTVNKFEQELNLRKRVVTHLCDPPKPGNIDAGHVREQLLNDNLKIDDSLKILQGEAVIFLRGYGIGWLERWKNRRRIKKEQSVICKDAVSKKYRNYLQVRALNLAKK